jgi:hypothetical protein
MTLSTHFYFSYLLFLCYKVKLHHSIKVWFC